MEIFLIIILTIIGFALGMFINSKLHPIKEQSINKNIIEKNKELEFQQEQLKQNLFKAGQELDNTVLAVARRREELQTTIEQEASIVRSIVEQEKDRMAEALSNYIDTLEFSYCETEEEYDRKMASLKKSLDTLMSTRENTIQAFLREKEIQEQSEFYKIKINKADLEDIKLLEEIKPRLRRPDVLSKLIWTTYYQKNLNTLCSNLTGDKIVSGIYKITDVTSGLAYIGQSVNIAQRWKDHVKNALGAGTRPSNNKLYTAMEENGVHNFTFEILEQVPSSQLNEKERYYIDLYKSATYGLNTTKGNQ